MDIVSARTRELLTLAALALIAPACWARPLLVPPKHLDLPLPPGAQAGGPFDPDYRAAAIDGDTVFVAANRAITATNDRVNGVYIFQRAANGNWNYAGPLVEGQLGAPLLNGNLATVQFSGSLQVYERGAQGWSLNATIPLDQLDHVFRLDEGAIYVRRNPSVWPPPSCLPPFRQYRKVNGSWSVVATIGGERCDDHVADVNDGRALVVRERLGDPTTRLPAQVFADTGAASWPLVASFATPPPNTGYVNIYGRGGSIRGNLAHIDLGYFYRDSGNNNWVPAGKMVEPEVELSIFSNGGILRGSHLFLYGLESDYELPFTVQEVFTEWHTLRAYREQPNGTFQYYAKLSADFNVWQWAVSENGTRVAAISPDSNWAFEGANRLYVFEIPEGATFPGTQQDTFESGNFARWTPTAGEFAVASTSSSRVLRQSSLAGDAGANLTAIDWNDQSIEADIRPLEFAGNGRWFGLVTRRVDSNNYYYVTFRSPDLISLRRLRNGVVTELGLSRAPANFTPGRSYRVRLESVGDQHAVFLEGIPRVHAKDTTFAHGHPGVAGYRARFDVDNVVVSGGTRLALRLDTGERSWKSQGPEGSTSWQFIAADGLFGLRQSDNTGDVRWISKVAVGNQVVSARVRPMSYGATTGAQDPWVGIAAHLVDEQNYYYVTLRRSNQLSLRRVVNGQIQILATVPQPVATGTWYDLRLEMIGTNIRAYVNGDLRIQTRDSTLSGGGRSALLMYKTAADFGSYIAYQP